MYSSIVGQNVVRFVDFLEAQCPCLSVFLVDRSIRMIGKCCALVRFADNLAISVVGDV
jgi:hypothetical protein